MRRLRKLSEAAIEEEDLAHGTQHYVGDSHVPGAIKMNEQAFESLPQRGSGRGRKSTAADAQQSPGVAAELGDRLGSTMYHLELQGSAEGSAAMSGTLYRKDAEGDACYECESR